MYYGLVKYLSVYMNKQLVYEQLTQLGLDEIEANIYLFLLENGAKTPLELSREANINRSKIYRHMEALKAKKLIEETSGSRGKKFTAANPTNLELLLKEKEAKLQLQKETLPTLLAQLTSLPTSLQKIFEIKTYHGPEGMKQLLWNQLSANKELVSFSYQNKNYMVGKAFAEKIREEQVGRRLKLYEIENETDQGDFWYTNVAGLEKFYKSRYIDPKILKIRQYIAIFNNTVSIANWIDKAEVGIEIVNEPFAAMQRQLFWKFWDIAADYVGEAKKLEAAKKLKSK